MIWTTISCSLTDHKLSLQSESSRAPPRLELGPPAPEAGILPLNYGAYVRSQITHMRLPQQNRGAPPGLEPGPPAPEAGILPLNYGAKCYASAGGTMQTIAELANIRQRQVDSLQLWDGT
ncbi:hypothetical protein PROFUN_13467 [Planoprotostelium fungivorum]|uniref:Uncharacterized protein n=1 Tax=Planoprotostelium fungivorum TaxID=1890364 RepID=A0A2P6N3T8_9EUKA|nr:hypothetical protein PROFUN_13467 [Planoprotostelium fungivorum]